MTPTEMNEAFRAMARHESNRPYAVDFEEMIADLDREAQLVRVPARRLAQPHESMSPARRYDYR